MKKVFFINEKHECINFILVAANTCEEAFEQAEKWYKVTKQAFYYMAMETEK